MDRPSHHPLLPILAGVMFIALGNSHTFSDEAPPKGRMITIRGTIDSTLVQRVTAAMRDAAKEDVEILIFDIQAGASDFGSCYEMANQIAQIGGSVRRTIAFVSKPLAGNPVLVALACDEVVMSEKATIGDVGDLKDREKRVFADIAVEKGHGRLVGLGLADRDLEIIEVETPNGKTLKSADELKELEKTTKILKREVIKEPGQIWNLQADMARRIGFVRLTRESRKDVAVAYGLGENIAAEDATFKETAKPMVLRIEGIVNQRMYQSIQRRLRDAQKQGCNLLFVEIDSTDGELVAASNIMNSLRNWQGQKVAWVPKSASGPAILAIFGCDELAMGPEAVIGGLEPDGQEDVFERLSDAAAEAGRDGRFPAAIVRGFIDPNEVVFEVRNKENRGIRSFRTEKELADEAVAAEWEKSREVKAKGQVMRIVGGDEGRALDLAALVVDSREQLLKSFSAGDDVLVLKPNWVDALVDSLTSPGATVFLLVVAMTCLYIEFQMPGFGIGGLISVVCFALFFWSRFLSDTANSLEIIMFLLGVAFLAIELFVLPGFGVTGIAGLLLMIASLVLAMQSFPWPTTEAQSQQLLGNVGQLFASMIVFLVVAGVVARYFPHLPMFNRMVLPPPELAEGHDEGFIDEDSDSGVPEMLGAIGVAASPLRPAGRMKLGGRLLDVVAQGEFIEQGRSVEVIEVYQNRIVVRSTRRSPTA